MVLYTYYTFESTLIVGKNTLVQDNNWFRAITSRGITNETKYTRYTFF